MLLVHSFLYAQKNIRSDEVNYIDILHSNYSKYVLYFADYIDNKVSAWMGSSQDTVTCDIVSNVQKESKTIDSFFQSRKYFNETDNVFIRLRSDTQLQTKENSHYKIKFSAQMPFTRCRKQLKIFAENMSAYNSKVHSTNEEKNPDFGIRYFDVYKGIDSRYSLGLGGIHPFISAQYSYIYHAKHWEIEPVQTFQYSSKYHFEEETNIYFDNKIDNTSLFRVTLLRKTKAHVDGMDYGIRTEYYFNSKKNKGMRMTQAFMGNTKYHYTLKDSMLNKQSKTFGGINNYISSFSWRENIWRDWFYYEITPSVNFKIDYDYKPNYAIRIFFDFYFGKYN